MHQFYFYLSHSLCMDVFVCVGESEREREGKILSWLHKYPLITRSKNNTTMKWLHYKIVYFFRWHKSDCVSMCAVYSFLTTVAIMWCSKRMRGTRILCSPSMTSLPDTNGLETNLHSTRILHFVVGVNFYYLLSLSTVTLFII